MTNGAYLLSNDVMKITVEPAIPAGCKHISGYNVCVNRTKTFYPNKIAALEAANQILSQNNVINVEGFIEHLETISLIDLSEDYIATIRNIIDYGLRHECLAPNQFVDWLISMIAGLDKHNVVKFINSYWLDDNYRLIKENQHFVVKEWVNSSDVKEGYPGFLDMGVKRGMYRAYRIECKTPDGTVWIQGFVAKESIMEHFNGPFYLDTYNYRGYKPTGRIAFMGYFKRTMNGCFTLVE
jgi:hypothetical protein